MPLPDYGVVVGTLNRFTREDPNNFGSWYHGKIYVDTPNGQYECAVDVSTPSGIKVQYRVVRNLDQKLFSVISESSSGWHVLDRTSESGALDYVRSPLFRINIGCFTFIASAFIKALRQLLEYLLSRWIDSTGDNALNVLEARLSASTRVFVFGAPYTSGRGVHDIHMNQGDPPGQFQHLDGIWQDGGTIIERPGGELVAFITKFETQSLNTNDSGLPV
jgi:uncharacterized protein YukJ